MKPTYLLLILIFPFVSLMNCSKDSIGHKHNHREGDKILSLLGQWEAIGFYDTYSMSPKPQQKWTPYQEGERFTYKFNSNGQLGASGKLKGCQYQRYDLIDSIHLRLFSNICDTEKYTILKLTTDSLYLSKVWYEDQYIYVFVRESLKE